MTVTTDIVAKLWRLCDILRDDGITYHEYVTELTYLLFLKMMAETGREDQLPEGKRWGDLVRREGLEQLTFYKHLLLDLGTNGRGLVLAIFVDAQSRLKKPTNLKAIVEAIDGLDWFTAREEGLGNLYEGLLEKNAAEKKSGAGQYFTPRPLIDCIIRLIKPQPGEVIQDPAAGTAGFLVAADHYIKAQTDDLYALAEEQRFFQRNNAFVGLELVADTHRLCLMNLMLHGIGGDAGYGVQQGDTLSHEGESLGQANVIITNPLFGNKKGGGRPTRGDFSVTADVSNKQLAFVEHVIRALRPGGRAAIVVPDNVLSEDNAGRALRQMLMDWCDLHTVLRLPTGIFYAQGVKTNVIFFTKGKTAKANTRAVWVYDMRINMPAFGKTRPLTVESFAEFETCYGPDPFGKSPRIDQGEDGRWKCFTRQQILDRNDNLDITWLREETSDPEDGLSEPFAIATAILGHLKTAIDEVVALADEVTGQADADEDGVLPDGWAIASITELFDINPKHAQDTDRSINVSFIPMPAVDDIEGKILPHSTRPLSEVWTGYTHFSEGDVLFAKITPCMENGKIAVAEHLTGGIGCGSTEFHVLRSQGAVLPRLLHRFLRQQYFRNDAEAAMTGAVGQRRVPREFIEYTDFPVPPLSEQVRLVEKIEFLFGRIAKIKKEISKVLAGNSRAISIQCLLARIEQAILDKAFTGKLVPQDPADEPASKLLDRIKAARESAPKAKRGRRSKA